MNCRSICLLSFSFLRSWRINLLNMVNETFKSWPFLLVLTIFPNTSSRLQLTVDFGSIRQSRMWNYPTSSKNSLNRSHTGKDDAHANDWNKSHKLCLFLIWVFENLSSIYPRPAHSAYCKSTLAMPIFLMKSVIAITGTFVISGSKFTLSNLKNELQ